MRFLLFILLSMLTACAKQSGLSALNANTVEVLNDNNQYPSTVLVVLPEGRGICSGTFISPRAVLTAAHCTLRSGSYRVVTGFGTFSTSTRENFGQGVLDDPNDISLLIFPTAVARRSLGRVAPVAEEAQSGETVRLVGYGCNDISTKQGAGIKRTGLNTVSSVSDYISLYTPWVTNTTQASGVASGTYGIFGPRNQAASCNGDSGGPMFRMAGDQLGLVGVCHAGGSNSSLVISQYININQSGNREFLEDMDHRYDLGIFDVCDPEDMLSGGACETQSASMQITLFLKKVWTWIAGWFL